MDIKKSLYFVACLIIALLILFYICCSTPFVGSEVANEKTVSLVGRVLNKDSTGIANIVAKLSIVGLSDITDNNGNYAITATQEELDRIGINLDTIPYDTVQIMNKNVPPLG